MNNSANPVNISNSDSNSNSANNATLSRTRALQISYRLAKNVYKMSPTANNGLMVNGLRAKLNAVENRVISGPAPVLR